MKFIFNMFKKKQDVHRDMEINIGGHLVPKSNHVDVLIDVGDIEFFNILPNTLGRYGYDIFTDLNTMEVRTDPRIIAEFNRWGNETVMAPGCIGKVVSVPKYNDDGTEIEWTIANFGDINPECIVEKHRTWG